MPRHAIQVADGMVARIGEQAREARTRCASVPEICSEHVIRITMSEAPMFMLLNMK
jgi:hypothetical protein